MSEPLISVIVPVYKVEDFLEKCVDSIRNQTYENLEIILVDDGSPDNCGAICDEYALIDQRIRVIHKQNGGLSSARNAGLDVASGKYIAFVDSDDWIDIDGIERLYDLACRYGAKMVCAGRYDVDGKTGNETIGLCPCKEEVVSGLELAKRIFLWDHIDSAAWDKLYARELFAEIRYPIGIISEDLPVTYRLAFLAGDCVLGNFPFYHYYHRSGSITTVGISNKSFDYPNSAASIDKYIKANYPQISDASFYLKVRALIWILQMVDISSAEVQKEFYGRCQGYRMQLREALAECIYSVHFSAKEKIIAVLLCFRLYKYLRKIVHFFKK